MDYFTKWFYTVPCVICKKSYIFLAFDILMKAYNNSGNELDIIHLHKFNPIVTPRRLTTGYNVFN